jgi:hypothetical protein
VFANHTVGATSTMDVTLSNLSVLSTAGLGIDVDGAGSALFNFRIANTDETTLISESVDIDGSGSGPFKVLLDNANITTGGADVALSVTFANTADGDLTIRNDSDIVAANARAFDMAVNGAGTEVAVLVEASTFTSATAEDFALVNNTGAQTEATIRNNTFTDSAGDDAVISSLGSNGAGTRLDLNLVGNGAAASTIRLVTNEIVNPPFNFGVVDRDNVNDNNPATVILAPAPANFEDIDASDVELPNGP